MPVKDSQSAFKAYNRQAIEANGYMDIDLHIHTKYSADSLNEPKIVLKQALRMGLSAIAITDHNTINGSLSTLALKREAGDLLIIPGVEIRTQFGDLIVLFTYSRIRSKDFYEVLDEAKDQNAIVILPHPLRSKVEKSNMTLLDGVEAFNGRRPFNENEVALEIAEKLGLPAFSSSDAHFYFEIGKARTRLYTRVNSLDELRKSILSCPRALLFKRSRITQMGAHYLSCGVQIIRRSGTFTN